MATQIIANREAGQNYDSVKNLGFSSYSSRQYEPQTQNTFAFEFFFDAGQVKYISTFANKMGGLGADVTGKKNFSTDFLDGLSDINEVLNSSMQQFNSPTKTIGQVVIDYFNSQIKFAGKPTFSNANITLNTLIGLGSKNVLAGWADICLNDRNLKGGWARSVDNIKTKASEITGTDDYVLDALFPYIGYKVDGRLLECARDGTIVNAWDYIGMWVSTFTPGNFNMAGSSSTAQVSATITVDRIVQSAYSISDSKDIIVNRT